jgi:hypothetical protein
VLLRTRSSCDAKQHAGYPCLHGVQISLGHRMHCYPSGTLLASIVGEARGKASARFTADATALGSTSAACSTRPEALDPRLNRGEQR